MQSSNLDIYLEQLRQECAQARRVRLEQKRISAVHCARIRDLVGELEEVYIAMLWQQAELTKQRGGFADLFARQHRYKHN